MTATLRDSRFLKSKKSVLMYCNLC